MISMQEVTAQIEAFKAENNLEIITRSRNGVIKKDLNLVCDILKLSQKKRAEIAGISVRSFQRYTTSTRLSNTAAETIVSLFNTIRLGLDLFDDPEGLSQWMEMSNSNLNGLKPIDIISYHSGIEEINTLLTQNLYGIYV